MSGKKYTSLSIKEKLKIINESKEKSKAELCDKYKCSLSTLNRVLRDVRGIVKKSEHCELSRKRERLGSCKEVEQALLAWFAEMRSSGAALSVSILMDKAKQFAVMVNKDFTPTAGWLWRWQRRHGIAMKTSKGDQSSAENIRNSVPPNLMSSYAANDIFNAAVTGLYYKALPTSTDVKDRLTLLFICNATGDYKKLIVIGKTRASRCFKNKVLPLQYFYNERAWLTESIWAEIMYSLDEEMTQQQRKIILFVENAPCHMKLNDLQNTNVQSLPPNSTPLNQGIIHCFKAHYRRNIVRKQVAAMESGKTMNEFLKSITTLQAMHISKHCLWLITPATISNSFRKVIFVQEEEQKAQIKSELDIVDSQDESNSHCDVYAACDDNLSCYGELADAEVVHDNEEEEFKEELEHVPPSTLEILQSIQNLRAYFLPLNRFAIELEDMEEYVIENSELMQTKIADFLKPHKS